MTCHRYDALHEAGEVPAPEVIKLDVEGFEYEVLQGFGLLLENCLGIEVETWIYPVYQGTKLLGDIVSHLRSFGLMLRRFEPLDAFDHDLFVGNAFFTMSRQRVSQLDPVRRRKFDLLLMFGTFLPARSRRCCRTRPPAFKPSLSDRDLCRAGHVQTGPHRRLTPPMAGSDRRVLVEADEAADVRPR